MRSWPARFAALGLLIPLALVSPCRAGDGLLGIFFDRDGRTCSGDVPTASFSTLYVVLLTEGGTYGGITGAEFRIDTSAASGFFFQNERAESGAILLGSPLGSGGNVAFSSCQSGSSAPVLSFQVYNTGAARDGAVRIIARSVPSNPNFACPLAVECDADTYSKVCVEGGIARLNPASPRPCGSSRVDSEWTHVKELFR